MSCKDGPWSKHVKLCDKSFGPKKLQLSGGQNLSSTFQPKDIFEATFLRILTNPNQAWLFDTWSKYCMSVRIYLFHLSTEIWSSLISAVSVLDQTQVLPCPEKVVPCWVSSLIIWLCDTLTMITPKIKSKLWLMNVISIHLYTQFQMRMLEASINWQPDMPALV